MEKWKLGLIILMFISIIVFVYLFFTYSSVEEVQDAISSVIEGTETESTTTQTQETTTQTSSEGGGGGGSEGGGGGGGGGGSEGPSITTYVLEVNSTPTESEIYITYDYDNQTFNTTITTPKVLYADVGSTVCLMPVYTKVTVLWYVDDGYCEYLCYDSEYSCGFAMTKNRAAKLVKGEITP